MQMGDQLTNLAAPPIRVSVAGASGYAGGELVRLLANHPAVEIVHLAAGAQAGKPLDAVFPSLANLTGLAAQRLGGRVLVEPDYEQMAKDSDAVFLALPHGLSLEAVPQLLDGGCKVVDLGGDFRLTEPAVFEQWYDTKHTAPDLLSESVYGLPELFRKEIRTARLVANPGCYPTAAALALMPLAEAGLLSGASVIVDAKSGVSGAGRKGSVTFGYSEVNENLRAYSVLQHRHQPEMEQTLKFAAQRSGQASDASDTSVSFIPHLVPMTRGILATCYATLSSDVSEGVSSATSSDVQSEAVAALYRDRYQQEPFVRFLENEALPATKNVAGSNFCEVAVRFDAKSRLVVAIAAIDNLGKGAASAALANFNLQWGLDEALGLSGLAVFP